MQGRFRDSAHLSFPKMMWVGAIRLILKEVRDRSFCGSAGTPDYQCGENAGRKSIILGQAFSMLFQKGSENNWVTKIHEGHRPGKSGHGVLSSDIVGSLPHAHFVSLPGPAQVRQEVDGSEVNATSSPVPEILE